MQAVFRSPDRQAVAAFWLERLLDTLLKTPAHSGVHCSLSSTLCRCILLTLVVHQGGMQALLSCDITTLLSRQAIARLFSDTMLVVGFIS